MNKEGRFKHRNNPAQTAYSRNGKWQHMHPYNHMGNNNSMSQCTA